MSMEYEGVEITDSIFPDRDDVVVLSIKRRQIGNAIAIKEIIEKLMAEGKTAIIFVDDSPRRPLLGAIQGSIGDPDLEMVDAFRKQFSGFFEPKFLGRPSAGETMLLSSLDRMFPQEESKDAMLDRFMTSMMTPSREWLDPIPEPIVKKEKNKLGFLDGLGYKTRKHGR